MSDSQQTPGDPSKFDASRFPEDTLFYDRRTGLERREALKKLQPPAPPVPAGERREKKERRRRVDPTTFEKQYSDDEMEFMTAMQAFKNRSGKAFPSFSEVLRVAHSLGYRRPEILEAEIEDEGVASAYVSIVSGLFPTIPLGITG